MKSAIFKHGQMRDKVPTWPPQRVYRRWPSRAASQLHRLHHHLSLHSLLFHFQVSFLAPFIQLLFHPPPSLFSFTIFTLSYEFLFLRQEQKIFLIRIKKKMDKTKNYFIFIRVSLFYNRDGFFFFSKPPMYIFQFLCALFIPADEEDEILRYWQ